MCCFDLLNEFLRQQWLACSNGDQGLLAQWAVYLLGAKGVLQYCDEVEVGWESFDVTGFVQLTFDIATDCIIWTGVDAAKLVHALLSGESLK